MNVRIACLFVPALVALSLAARTPAAVDKTIILTALDGSSKPVMDLKLEDVRLREDGADREIVSVKPSTQPLSVMLHPGCEGERDALQTVPLSAWPIASYSGLW